MFPLELIDVILGYTFFITNKLSNILKEQNRVMMIDDYEYLMEEKERKEQKHKNV